VLMYL